MARRIRGKLAGAALAALALLSLEAPAQVGDGASGAADGPQAAPQQPKAGTGAPVRFSRQDLDKVLARLFQDLFSGGTAADRAPTPEEIERTDVSLPFALPAEGRGDCEHLIFWDNTGRGALSSYHEPLWKKQAEVLGRRLGAIPVDPARIHVIPVKSPQDFLEAIERHEGSKRLYIFGHGQPFVIFFGTHSVRLAEQAENFKAEQVEMVCHYGCSFVGEDPEELAVVQGRLAEGQELLLYGHRKPSYKTDDSPWDPHNPILRCEVGKDCVKTQTAPERIMEFARGIAARFYHPPFPR